MGFQVGWLLVGQQRCNVFDCSGIDESCAQPSPKLGEHRENQKIKDNKSFLCLARTEQGTCRCAELLPVRKEDEIAWRHLEIPQLPHVVTLDKHQCETRRVGHLQVTPLLHGSTKSRFCNQ